MKMRYAAAIVWACALVAILLLSVQHVNGSVAPTPNTSVVGQITSSHRLEGVGRIDKSLQFYNAAQKASVRPRKAPTPEIATLVAKYSTMYGTSRQTLLCLLEKESSYGKNKGHGDHGKAGGPLQFHQPTWNELRKKMGKPLGSRYNMEQSIETASWAISKGMGYLWGPIQRGECK